MPYVMLNVMPYVMLNVMPYVMLNGAVPYRRVPTHCLMFVWHIFTREALIYYYWPIGRLA